VYIKKKNIALCIVFSVITCGLYMLYWLYCLAEDLCCVAKREMSGGGMVLLFSIITCGIYELYWYYRAGETLEELRREQGRSGGYLGILYLVLGLLGFGIISFALIQNELNEYAQ